MNNNLYIASYCHIKDNAVSIDGNLYIDKEKALSLSEFLKKIYKESNIKYSKFFKMDSLSKLAFLGAELLLSDIDVNLEEKNIAVVLSNKASSLDTDRKHQQSIEDKENYYPSPSVFVYTLPNITIGEISIRHQLKSENAFFINDQFDPDFLNNYISILVDNKKANSVLCGWVDVDDNNYELFMFLAAKKGKVECTKSTLKRLYRE